MTDAVSNDECRTAETPVSVAPAPSQRRSGTAIVMLVVCCLLWGLSFPLVQKAMRIVEGTDGGMAGPLVFNGWRFLSAAALYVMLTAKRQRRFLADDWRGGLSTGLFFGAGVFFQLWGLRYTTPSISAFLTALAVVFTPIAQSLVLRRPVRARVWLSVAMASFGTLLLSWQGGGSAGELVQTPPVPFMGEILTVFSATMFTGQILALDRYGKHADAARLTFLMFASCGVASLCLGVAAGGSHYLMPAALVRVFTNGQFLVLMLLLVALCSVMAMHLMNSFQPLIAPAIATVVYCMEPVFATGYSLALGAERLTLHVAVGGAVILLAVLLIARGE